MDMISFPLHYVFWEKARHPYISPKTNHAICAFTARALFCILLTKTLLIMNLECRQWVQAESGKTVVYVLTCVRSHSAAGLLLPLGSGPSCPCSKWHAVCFGKKRLSRWPQKRWPGRGIVDLEYPNVHMSVA